MTTKPRPRLIEPHLLAAALTYRDAVLGCWAWRNRPHMTRRQLAEEAGIWPSHISEFLSRNEDRRELPAKYIQAFEESCGNRFISQWVARKSGLVVTGQEAHGD